MLVSRRSREVAGAGEGDRRLERLSCRTANRKATFGELAADAAEAEGCPKDVPLKDPKDFVYIGKTRAPHRCARKIDRGPRGFTQGREAARPC